MDAAVSFCWGSPSAVSWPREPPRSSIASALVCVDGLFDIYQVFTRALPEELRHFLEERKIDELNHAVAIGMMRNTHMRWAVEHGCWAFRASTPYEFLERTRTMSMRGSPGSRSNSPTHWGRRRPIAG